MAKLLRIGCTVVLATLVACASNPAPAAPDQEGRTRLTVENRSSLDMDIFARRPDGRETRLGFAAAGETTTFQLVPGVLVGGFAMTFAARPVRDQGQPVVSELFEVRPGGEVFWSVPPQ